MSFQKPFFAVFIAAFLLSPLTARADGPAETVERAHIIVKNVLSEPNFERAREQMRDAKAVLIMRLFKAGLIVGGEGGSGVLLARREDGSWSQPAFFSLAAGSVGLQIGVKDSEVIFIIRTKKGLDAILNDEVKLGGEVSVTAGTLGGGVSGATTTNMGADIVSWSLARGAYGGGAFEGALIKPLADDNAAYYAAELGPREIIFGDSAFNPGATPLRTTLGAY
ncbi:MAG: lipid-binding SYLF domain-containing protein [Magnetospiraceae bacterium]